MLTQDTRTRAVSPRAWENQVQGALDLIGLVPVLGVPAEIASAALSLRRGDLAGFGLSVAGLLPLAGEWAVALKIARTLHQSAAEGRAPALA
ncbi:MAG: hypothetical protein JO250_05130 [Armatimonadetes bacterium]|nr:hypothetical protein [Armatimonadota bacterium]